MAIKVWMLNQEGSIYTVATADASLSAVYKLRHNRHESLLEYRKRFVAATEVLEHIDLNLEKAFVGLTNKWIQAEEKNKRKDAISAQVETAEKSILEKFLACRFIAASDKFRFATVLVYLEIEYVDGRDKFPNDVTAAYKFLENWKRVVTHIDTPAYDGASFVQVDGGADRGEEPEAQKQRREMRDMLKRTCYRYGKFGHIRADKKYRPEDIERL